MYNSQSGVTKCFILVFLITIITLFAAFTCTAADVTIAWDANTESDLAGYKFFYGTASGNYDFSVDVGNATSYTVANLEEGVTYYFVAKAYNTSYIESAFSEELVHTVVAPNTAPDIPSTPTGPSTGYVMTSYSFGTSGSDPDGDLLEYRFDWGDGQISTWGSAYSRSHAYSSVGNYCVKAQSIDPYGAVSGWSPCLDINIDLQTYTITVSEGANGSISPSGPVTVSHGADQTFFITPDSNYYVADVLVDGASKGQVDSYTFAGVIQNHSISASFARQNQIPIADAGIDQNVPIKSTVQLDANGSSDPDGDPISFEWSFVSVPAGSTATLSSFTAAGPTFVADTAGSYIVQLIVHDGQLDSQPDAVTISTQNSPPVADAGVDQNVIEGQTAVLDGTSSTDPDGIIADYHWFQTAGPSVSLSDTSAVQPQFLAPDVGPDGATLTFDLTVTDSQGITDTDSCDIIVLWQNQPPTADAGPDQTVDSGKTVTLNGANSTDKEDGIVSYRWVQTSGSSVSVSDPSAAQPTFLTPDVDLQGLSVEFELTVTDANGLTNKDSCIVNITGHNEPPIADAGANIIATPGQSIVLDGSGSHDIDDGIAAYQWTQIEGNAVALSDAQTPSAVFIAPEVGNDGESFIFVLTVVDQGGLKDTDVCIVNVTWQNQPPSAVTNDYQETTEGFSIELDGLQSTDSEDGPIHYRWHQVEGSPVTFDDPEAPQTTFNAPQVEAYGDNLVFTLKVKDKGGLKDSAKCSIFVVPQNSAPIAADDAYGTVEGVQLIISAPGILANDSDANGQSLQSILVSNPDNGSLTLSADGSFIYAPSANFVGTDFFTYAANDGTMESNIATVFIKVNQSSPIIYVSDITVDFNKKGPSHQARAYVVIKDDAGNIVKEAAVNGKWRINDLIINEVSAVTNGVGEAKLDSDKVKAGSKDQMDFEIINVYKQGYTYDPIMNFMNNAFVEIP